MSMRGMLAIATCTLLSIGALLAQNPPAAPPSGGKIAFADTIHDFGRVKGGELLKHTFVFTNAGPETLSVTHVQPSCGCTTAGEWTKTVAPGATGSIPIQFNSGNFGGHVVKTVSVSSSDKSQPTVVLQIRADIWKPIEVNPQFAVINIPPDNDSGSVIVNILNNMEQPVTFGQPEVNNTNLVATLKEDPEKPGKQYRLTISNAHKLPTGNIQAQVTIKTSSTNVPVVTVTAWANVQPAMVVLPPQMTIPAPPLAAAITPSVLIQNNSTNALQISDPSVNAPGVKADIRETQPGRQFSVAVTFPSGFEIKPGQQVVFTAKTSNPSMPLIRVPISQMPRPTPAITLPPASAARQTHVAVPPRTTLPALRQ